MTSTSPIESYHAVLKRKINSSFGLIGACVMVLHGGTVPGGTACEGTAGDGTVGNSAAQSEGLGGTVR